MFGCGLWARFTRDRYNSLAVVAIMVGLLVFGLIITTIILHLAFLWLVLVSATIMLFTAFGYSTCTNKPTLVESLQQHSDTSESVSTISDHVAETVSVEDFPPCYEAIVTEGDHDNKPPSYLDALALQTAWSDTFTIKPDFYSSKLERYPDTSSQQEVVIVCPPPPYEELVSAPARDQLSEASLSLSENTSSLASTSSYSTSSHSSYESLYFEYDETGGTAEIIAVHCSGRGCGSEDYQANLYPGQFSGMPSIATIC